MDNKTFYQELYNRYGPVTRARNCFLYTKKEIRLTDMNQENGRAILGWDAGNAFTHFKNTMNKALTGSFITEDSSRIHKAISKLLNSERDVFFFYSKQDALKAALTVSPAGTSFYRPWNPETIEWKNVDTVILVPPFPWTDSIYIVATKKSTIPVDFSLGTKIPFALEAGITRAIYNLIDELPNRQEKDWFIYDTVLTKYWERKGPYLFPKISENQYDAFVLHCLDLGIVINPDYNSPSIIPFGADKGVFSKLKNCPFTTAENK